jgi:2-oxoisovalerate dehydrogenase E1 component alpha subunit
MTYRLGHHSTSDDSSRYRTTSEIEEWKQNHNPITRVKNYLLKQGWWSEESEQALHKDLRKQVLESLKKAEQEKKPSINELFTDVYDTLPPHLQEQKKQLEEHLAKYPEAYPLNQHAQ